MGVKQSNASIIFFVVDIVVTIFFLIISKVFMFLFMPKIVYTIVGISLPLRNSVTKFCKQNICKK